MYNVYSKYKTFSHLG